MAITKTTVTHSLIDPSASPVQRGGTITLGGFVGREWRNVEGMSADGQIITWEPASADETGSWSVDLIPNAAITPENTLYRYLPASGQPVVFQVGDVSPSALADLLVTDPAQWPGLAPTVVGPPGPPNTLTPGTATTGLPGTDMSFEITGTAPNQVLNMTVPRGDAGSVTAVQGVAPDAGGNVDLSAAITDVADSHYLALVDDLTYPLAIAHRGASNLAPEETMAAFEAALAMPGVAVEMDVQMSADGVLMCMHDLAVDRTTNGVGNVADIGGSAYWSGAIKVDSSTWMGGGWGDQPVPLFSDVLNAIGGRCVIFPEVKDQQIATATAMCDMLDARGLRRSAVIHSFSYAAAQYAASRGYAAMPTPTVAASPTPATMKADGIWAVGHSMDDPNLTSTWVDQCHAAGLKVFAYTANRQSEWNAAIAKGVDGLWTNEPLYASGNVDRYRTATTSWKRDGTWGHGQAAYVGWGPFTITDRGNVFGKPGLARWDMSKRFLTPGNILPLADPSGTYAITVVFAFDALSTNTVEGPKLQFCAASDQVVMADNGVDQRDCYLAKLRANGVVTLFVNTATVAGLGNTTGGTAVQMLTTTAALTQGAAYTTIPVAALTAPVNAGHQWYLPDGTYVTASASASVGATSVSVTSFTPATTISGGASLIPRVTMEVTVSPTQITVRRVDDTAASTITVTDTTFRGAYVSIDQTGAGGLRTSCESITVS